MRLAEPLSKGPKGQKRPANVIGNAVYVMRIATGEIEKSGQTEHGKSTETESSAPYQLLAVYAALLQKRKRVRELIGSLP
jgi:hypothetical protein